MKKQISSQLSADENWLLVESQNDWLSVLLSRVRLPAGVHREDVLSELRLELFKAFASSYDAAKSKPTTFSTKVFARRIERIIKRLAPDGFELTSEPLAPEHDSRLDDIHALINSDCLTDVERFAVDQIRVYGRVTYHAIKARFPGEFAFETEAQSRENKLTFVSNLLNGIKAKL